jgi:hypothetical protein
MNIDDLILYINQSGQHVFIEVEGKPEKIQRFIAKYNSDYGQNLTANSDGIITLKPTANKWDVELRIYFVTRTDMPVDYFRKTTKNSFYRDNYNFRINNNGIARELFNRGFHIGLN